jgi:hypothetical protein
MLSAKAAKCNRVPDTALFLSALATLVPVFLIVTKFLPFSLLAPRWYSAAVKAKGREVVDFGSVL